jgi:alkaline phosphatase
VAAASGASANAPAKNVILFLGDGMNIPTVTAARILEGQQHGQTGEENVLSFELLPYTAFSKTYAVDAQVNDSAGTMTAIVTGVKTRMGVLSMSPSAQYGQWKTGPGNAVPTILELAEARGLSTGVVSTTRVTHATPAACYSHSVHRDWGSDSNLPADAKAGGVKDIARQLVEFPIGNGLEVALGGGRSYFLPKETADPEYSNRTGNRTDKLDLTAVWKQRGANWKYVWNKAQSEAINPADTDHLLALFEPSHMQYEADRANDAGREPSLSEMTSKAIDILSKNPSGYFLMVEGGRIDHAHHANNAYRALTDTIEFASAVIEAMYKANPADTLILVTADHGHMMTIAGYPVRGNPILGKVRERAYSGADVSIQLAKDTNGLPYTTLTYVNGPGYKSPRADLSAVNTEDPNYIQEAAIPTVEDTHSGEDMPVYAGGAGAQNVRGALEQNLLFNIMARALGLTSWAEGWMSTMQVSHSLEAPEPRSPGASSSRGR